MRWRERIVSDADTLNGKLRVKGTRIPVSVVLDNLAARLDFREILASYPSLTEDDVRACIAWAAECAHAIERLDGREGAVDAKLEGSPEPDAGTARGFKNFLRSMPDVGDDADFERPLEYGRPDAFGAEGTSTEPERGAAEPGTEAPQEPMVYDFLVLGPDVGEDSDFERRRRA